MSAKMEADIMQLQAAVKDLIVVVTAQGEMIKEIMTREETVIDGVQSHRNGKDKVKKAVR